MKVNVYSINGEVKEDIELPAIFDEVYRPDLIKRAVLSAQSARVQPWGNRAEKNHHEKINIKERRFAIRSAVAATVNKELVEDRGHKVEDLEQVPIIVEDDIEEVKTTKQTREIFQKLGVYDDIIRAKEGKRIRAGRGKTRGRKYKKVKGPLVVVGEDKGISLGARNHAGVDVVVAENLNAELLAPGTHPGRLTIYTKSAVEKLGGLFQ